MTKPRQRGQRLMYTGYAEILRAVANDGATWMDVAERCNIGRLSAQKILAHLVDAEVIHEAEWARRVVSVRATYMPVYRIGQGGPLLTWPGDGERKPRRRRPPPLELLTFIHAVRALQADNHHGRSLSQTVGMSPRVALALLHRMHKLRLVYIDDHERRANGGAGYPLYAWGVDQRDAQKPKPIPKQELWARWNHYRRARKQTATMLGIATAANAPQITQRA